MKRGKYLDWGNGGLSFKKRRADTENIPGWKRRCLKLKYTWYLRVTRMAQEQKNHTTCAPWQDPDHNFWLKQIPISQLHPSPYAPHFGNSAFEKPAARRGRTSGQSWNDECIPKAVVSSPRLFSSPTAWRRRGCQGSGGAFRCYCFSNNL